MKHPCLITEPGPLSTQIAKEANRVSQIIIFRTDDGVHCENTVAIVQWDSNPQVPNGVALKAALTAAVTDWMTNDDYGREVFDEIGNEFNVADLLNELPGNQPLGWRDTLTPYLYKYHVFGLKVNTLDKSDSVSGWDFDDSLVNSE
jgi:hypothetical protein